METILAMIKKEFAQLKQEHLGPRILEAIQGGDVVFFVLVTRKVGAVGEPPITAEDLALMQLPDGRSIAIILASTKLTPDNLSTGLEARGVYVRQLSSKVLLELCLQRGIKAIELDGGVTTEVLIGPIGHDDALEVVVVPRESRAP